MVSCYIGEVRDIFQNFFAPNSDTQDHYIKQSANYHVPHGKNNLGKWSIRYGVGGVGYQRKTYWGRDKMGDIL